MSETQDIRIEPTLLVVLLQCKQVCDTILQSIIEDGEIDELIAPFREDLEASLMNQNLHFVSQSLVIANRSERLQLAIAGSMHRVEALMLQMADAIVPLTNKEIEEPNAK